MNDDLQIEDLDSSNVTVASTESTRSSPAAPTNTDAPTDYSGHSLNGSGPSTPTATDYFNTAPDMSSVKVYYPYDIEEPDHEPDPVVQRLELPRLPDSFEGWQRDLLDCMNGMGNDTPDTVSNPLMGPPKGQKRKPGSISGVGYQSSHSHSTLNTGPGEKPLSVPGLGSKRRRRRSKLPEDHMKAGYSASLHEVREDGDNRSSSSDLWSTDSSADTMHESAVADDMDID
ncbi:hypothetical protein N7490_011850 [Penicillium lividum]|nr:hypothetical protein N7490_011850 [Penicillium lividum]